VILKTVCEFIAMEDVKTDLMGNIVYTVFDVYFCPAIGCDGLCL